MSHYYAAVAYIEIGRIETLTWRKRRRYMSLFQCFIISLIAVASQLDSRILGRTNLERPLITCTLVDFF